MATPSFAWSLDSSHPQTLVGGDHLMYHRHRRPRMFRNLRSRSWVNQRIVNDKPALPTPRPWIPFHFGFHFFHRQMRSCSRDSCHSFLLQTLSSLSFPLFYPSSSSERKLVSTGVQLELMRPCGHITCSASQSMEKWVRS